MGTDLRKELPSRKHPRMKQFDYSSSASYFVTICTQDRRRVLSNIVGRGLAPAANLAETAITVVLTRFGKIAEKQLLALEKRYPSVKVDQYVIMPDHIHAIIQIGLGASEADSCVISAGACPRPTLSQVVGAFKSLTTRECKKVRAFDRLFQISFYEHVIRGQQDYEEIVQYIYENPERWYHRSQTNSCSMEKMPNDIAGGL